MKSNDEIFEAIGRLTGEVSEVRSTVSDLWDLRFADHEEQRRHHRRLKDVETELARRSALESGPDWRVSPELVTGTYDIRVLQEESRERKSDAKHLRRKRLDWLVGAAGALAIVVLTTLATLFFKR